jgi:hypothetical protein
MVGMAMIAARGARRCAAQFDQTGWRVLVAYRAAFKTSGTIRPILWQLQTRE